jgi:hypothetical protein
MARFGGTSSEYPFLVFSAAVQKNPVIFISATDKISQ